MTRPKHLQLSITIDRTGPYRGEMDIDKPGDTVTVTYQGLSKSTPIGTMPVWILADLLLVELVRGSR